MHNFSVPIQIRWSDIDANRHLRHSAYYDYGAMMRMMVLNECGITTALMEQLRIGPVLFREEAIFRKEIILEDKIIIDVECTKATADFSRWSLRHNLAKEDGTIAAIINIDGAWIDLTKRKLAVPNEFIQKAFASFPKAVGFEEIPSKQRNEKV